MKNIINGFGFEYSMFQTLASTLSATYEHDKQFIKNEECYRQLSDELKEKFRKSSLLATNYLVKHEKSYVDGCKISMNNDCAGINGDVRDICIENAPGISLKNSNNSIRHTRVSKTLNNRLNLETNHDFENKIENIFESMSCKVGTKWEPTEQRQFVAKITDCVFENFNKTDLTKMIPITLGLIGSNGYYKVNRENNHVVIDDMRIEKLEFPENVLKIDKIGFNTIRLDMDCGYSFNFRIHTASSRVEKSAKIDVVQNGLPPSINRVVVS